MKLQSQYKCEIINSRIPAIFESISPLTREGKDNIPENCFFVGILGTKAQNVDK